MLYVILSSERSYKNIYAIEIKDCNVGIFNFVILLTLIAVELAASRPHSGLRLTSYSFFNFRRLWFHFLDASYLSRYIWLSSLVDGLFEFILTKLRPRNDGSSGSESTWSKVTKLKVVNAIQVGFACFHFNGNFFNILMPILYFICRLDNH